MKRIGVYCGSSFGHSTRYLEAALDLADLLMVHGYGLVYGGAHVGLMGALADRVLAQGGEVIGVIPRAMVDREIAHAGLTKLEVVETMHERKARMADLSDGFIALPGAFGTLDELFEVLTWAQLRIHDKPCGVLNIDGYYDRLLGFLDHCVTEGFLKAENRALLLVEAHAARLLERMTELRPVKQSLKWMEADIR